MMSCIMNNLSNQRNACSNQHSCTQNKIDYALIDEFHFQNDLRKNSLEEKTLQRDGRKVRSDHSDIWNANFKKILTFREKHGHCLVPCKYVADPSLSRWVKRQRHYYNLQMKGKPSPLTKERVEKLRRVGFVWHAKEALWQKRFGELQEFKRMYGHYSVPSIFPSNQPLATWVKCQRRQYELYLKGHPSFITPDRIRSLDECGFEWNAPSVLLSKTIRDKKPEENTRWIDIILSDLSSDDSILSCNPIRFATEDILSHA